MTEDEHQEVIDRLEKLIREIHKTMAAFEQSGMDTEMPQDYDKLHGILDQAVKDQRAHSLAMVDDHGADA